MKWIIWSCVTLATNKPSHGYNVSVCVCVCVSGTALLICLSICCVCGVWLHVYFYEARMTPLVNTIISVCVCIHVCVCVCLCPFVCVHVCVCTVSVSCISWHPNIELYPTELHTHTDARDRADPEQLFVYRFSRRPAARLTKVIRQRIVCPHFENL